MYCCGGEVRAGQWIRIFDKYRDGIEPFNDAAQETCEIMPGAAISTAAHAERGVRSTHGHL
jgi:hypothetical protein